ncbi:MAG: 2-C-methyl-D-erythritol 4-phosphate cytidylyltransferase [Erysipelotrichaceae bacterium]|nr:2-C-methyl-D-erythritol 4-phosphate cytidylyltransferase [Erysipelotrichaceae bacterium]
MEYSAIVLCAGSGTRTGLKYNKMFYQMQDQTVYEKILSVFRHDPQCREIIVVCKDDERPLFDELVQDERITYVTGGAERQDSVFAGLKAVTSDYVLIHDGARPYLKEASINGLLKCLEVHDACLLMVPCVDTIKRVIDGKVVTTLVRSELMQAQTPQAFKTDVILKAYATVIGQGLMATDDASMVELTGGDVYVVMGDYDNKKITTKEDLQI